MSSPRLHLFNPENDLALGLGVSHYTPPPVAAALHRAGGLLPAWWSRKGDAQLVADSTYEADAKWLRSRWGIEVSPVTVAPPDLLPTPWGWSTDTARQFAAVGVSPDILPSPSLLKRYRELSHRRSSIAILKALDVHQSIIPREYSDATEAVEAELARRGSYFKSPWSCSGRGVFCAGAMEAEALRTRVAGIIRRQGSVMVERGLNRRLDFAALFYADETGSVNFKGVSVFTTGRDGAYGGNVVASQERLRDIIAGTGAHGDIDSLFGRLEVILTDLVKGYHGWLGVDMMVYSDTNGQPSIHPCIELNLRTTMGVAAMAISQKIDLADPMLAGWHSISPGTTPPGELLLPPRDGFALTLTHCPF